MKKITFLFESIRPSHSYRKLIFLYSWLAVGIILPQDQPLENAKKIPSEKEIISMNPDLLDNDFYFDWDNALNNPETAPRKTPKFPPPISQKEIKNIIKIEENNSVQPTKNSTRPQPVAPPKSIPQSIPQPKISRITNFITNTLLKIMTNKVPSYQNQKKPSIVVNNTVIVTNKTLNPPPPKKEVPPKKIYLNFDIGYEFVKVRRMFHNQQYEQALLSLKRIEKIEPFNTRVYNIRGSIFYKLRFYEYAVENWQKSLTINPNQELVKRYLDKTISEYLNPIDPFSEE